jgi:hypothetical protein
VFATARAESMQDGEVDWEMVAMWADEVTIKLRQRFPEGSFYRWPDINRGMAATYAEFGMVIPQPMAVWCLKGINRESTLN